MTPRLLWRSANSRSFSGVPPLVSNLSLYHLLRLVIDAESAEASVSATSMASSAFRMAPSKVSILLVRQYALKYSRLRSLNRPIRSGRPGSAAHSAWSATSKSFRHFCFARILGSTWIALRRNWYGLIDVQRRFICIRYHRRSLVVGPVSEDTGKLRVDFRFYT